MTHLTPQARTDKNGRTVIRHMRSDAAQPGPLTGRTIPPVGSLSGPSAMAKHASDIHKMATSLSGPVPVPEVHHFEGFLELTQKRAPGLPELTKRVLTTGTPEAQSACVQYVQSYVKMFRAGQSSPVDGTVMANILRENWNESNVRVESGRSKLNQGSSESLIRTHQEGADVESDLYWRGIAAARIIVENCDRAFKLDNDNTLRFLNLAGKSDDIAAVIDVGIQRQTLDCDTIESVINESKNTVSLRDGVL